MLQKKQHSSILMVITYLDPQGHICDEPFIGSSKKDVIDTCQKMGKTPLSIKKVSTRSLSQLSTPLVLDFFHALSILLEAGQPLLSALNDIYQSFERRSTHQSMAHIVFFFIHHLKQGGGFSQAMALFPKFFDDTVVAMVERGLHAEHLHVTFERVYAFLKRRQAHKKAFQKALLYPAFLILGFICLFWVMADFFLPQVTSYLLETGYDALPLSSRSLLWFSDFFQHYASIMGISLIIVIISIFFFLQSSPCQKILTPWILKIPVIGPMYRTFHMLLWLETVGEFYGLDHNLKESLKNGAMAVKNPYFFLLLNKMNERVMMGADLCDAMEDLMPSNRSLFSPFTLSLCRLGMRSGQLSEFLLKAHKMEEHLLQEQMNFFLKILEPLLIITMGLLLLWIVMGAIFPLYDSLDLVFASNHEIIYKEGPIHL